MPPCAASLLHPGHLQEHPAPDQVVHQQDEVDPGHQALVGAGFYPVKPQRVHHHAEPGLGPVAYPSHPPFPPRLHHLPSPEPVGRCLIQPRDDSPLFRAGLRGSHGTAHAVPIPEGSVRAHLRSGTRPDRARTLIPHSAPPSLQEVISPRPQQAHRSLVMGGQAEDQGPALQLHQAHPEEEVEGPGGPGRGPSGRVGRSPENPKAWGEECGTLVVTSPETFCRGPMLACASMGWY
jgi:hypothetical protein